jgi:hypothetical protein
MIDDKNQIIRSMRSYEVGGSTDDSCMEEYMDASGKKRRRRKSKCGKTKTFRVRSTGDKVKLGAKVAGVAGAVIGGIAANKKYGLIDKLKEKLNLKKGGQIKKQMGGPIGDGKFLKNNPKLAAKIANAKTVIRNVKKIVKPRTKG